MAILNNLIVHGSSRFLNKAYFDAIKADLISANTGKFHYIEASTGSIDDLTSKHVITEVLDVERELHTKEWTNANIANIGGIFYVAPTVITKNKSPKISFSYNSTNGYTIQVSGTFATNFVKPGKATGAANWPSNSEILITGTAGNSSVEFPLGTLIGTLSGSHTVSASGTSKTITIKGVTDSKGNTDIIQELINTFGSNAVVDWLDGQLSLKTLGTAPVGIMLTSMGLDNKTYMDIYGGLNINGKPNVRIGDLNGIVATINGTNRTLEGWGIFTDNGYFEGEITSTVGYIGGFTIDDKSIHNGTNSVTSNIAGIYVGTDGIRNYANENTFVDIQNGVITAKGVNVSGTIDAVSGNIVNELDMLNDTVGKNEWARNNGKFRLTSDRSPASGKTYFNITVVQKQHNELNEFDYNNGKYYEAIIIVEDPDDPETTVYYGYGEVTSTYSYTFEDYLTQVETHETPVYLLDTVNVVNISSSNVDPLVSGYYELVGYSQDMEKYISSHMRFDSLGLHVIGDSYSNRVDISQDNGIIMYKEGQQIAQYGENIIVGDSNKFHIEITPNYNNTQEGRLSFYSNNNTEVAYISGNELYITQSVVLQQMDVGEKIIKNGLGQWSWKVHPVNGRNNYYLKWLG